MRIILIAIIYGFILPSKADFFTATDAYESGDFKSAYQQFFEMASIGEKRSQFNIGVMYFQGQHVEQDINTAYAWIKLSTDSDIMNESHSKILKHIESLLSDKNLAHQKYLDLVNKYSTNRLISTLYPEIVTVEESAAFNATPTKIDPPKYPKKAAIKGIQGWMRFGFDLDKNGIPRNIEVLESVPVGVFDKASLRAVKRWKFAPAKDEGGNPVAQPNLKYTMSFHIKEAGEMVIKKDLYDSILHDAKAGNANAQFKLGFYEKKLNISKGKENPNEWFLKAAIQGQPSAQFEIGQSLVYGQGCKLDQSKGIDWLTRAANNGEPRARQLLASSASKIETLESQKQSLKYTEGLEQRTPKVLIDQAWMLITSPHREISNPKLVLKLVKDLPKKKFHDDITIYEIKAAAFAAMGDFDEAVNYQEEALEEAEDRDADSETIVTRLASYKKKQKWF